MNVQLLRMWPTLYVREIQADVTPGPWVLSPGGVEIPLLATPSAALSSLVH